MSRIIASRVNFLQENLRRARLGQPLLETESGIEEFDGLNFELRKFVDSMRDQREVAERQQLTASEKGT